LTFDKQLERDGLLVGTYASLIELTGGILVLVHYDRYSAVSAVFRAFLEACDSLGGSKVDDVYCRDF
jgi:hypothetical protein